MTISQVNEIILMMTNFVQNILEHIFIRLNIFCEGNLSPVVFFVPLRSPDEQLEKGQSSEWRATPRFWKSIIRHA